MKQQTGMAEEGHTLPVIASWSAQHHPASLWKGRSWLQHLLVRALGSPVPPCSPSHLCEFGAEASLAIALSFGITEICEGSDNCRKEFHMKGSGE